MFCLKKSPPQRCLSLVVTSPKPSHFPCFVLATPPIHMMSTMLFPGRSPPAWSCLGPTRLNWWM